MKRALPAMFSKVDTLARLVVRSLPTPLYRELRKHREGAVAERVVREG